MRGTRAQNERAMKVPRGRRSSLSADKGGRTGAKCTELTVRKDEHALPCCIENGIQDPPAPLPDTKIKLQLYPIDEGTRIGLEKDGIHPYLELTLRPTKRISSVLKHISNKWKSSKVAVGEPMLVPYNIHDDTSRCSTWTMKDSDTRAGDVYSSIGRPETFRLRYGWVPPPEHKTSEEPSTVAIPYTGCLQSEDAQKDLGADVKIPDKYEDDMQWADNHTGQSEAPWIDEPTDVSIGAFLSEASWQAKLNTDEQRSAENDSDFQPAQISYSKTMIPVWADSLTNISIGGLLSEASLQGKFNRGSTTAKLIPSTADSQPAQIFSDSLDAFISARTKCPQGPRPPSHDSQLFILDGEETCHAFPVQKFTSSGKRVSAISGSSGGCNQDSGSRSFKFPKIDEVNAQSGVSEDQPCQDSRIDIFLSPQTFNDENSLGLANIKWSDSLGPFDLGLSASRKQL